MSAELSFAQRPAYQPRPRPRPLVAVPAVGALDDKQAPPAQHARSFSFTMLVLVALAHVAVAAAILALHPTEDFEPQVMPEPMMVSLLAAPAPEPEMVETIPLPKPEPVVQKIKPVQKVVKPQPKVVEPEQKLPEPMPVAEPEAPSEPMAPSVPVAMSQPVAEPVPEAAPAPAPVAPVAELPVVKEAPPIEDVVEPPKFGVAYLRNPAPSYPPISRRLGEEGRVVLRVLVTQSGDPDNVQIETGSGFSRLDKAALEAVRKWKFVPAKRSNQPVSAYARVPIQFALNR